MKKFALSFKIEAVMQWSGEATTLEEARQKGIIRVRDVYPTADIKVLSVDFSDE